MAEELREYFVSIEFKRNGTFCCIVRRDSDMVPKTVLALKTIVCSGADIDRLAKDFLVEFETEDAKKTNLWPPGIVVYCSDSDKTHTAVVLWPGPDESFCLFMTTNPYWNENARLATAEEIALCGWPKRSKPVYWAPVTRNNSYFVKSGITFPKHRIEELRKEFETARNSNV